MPLAIPLSRLRECFEGILPAVIATAAADGMPNVTYLSKVMLVDAEHIALTNQFFSKTLQNIRQNPRAQIVLLKPSTGQQFRIDVQYERSEHSGELFEQLRAELDAVASLMQMQDVFKLRAADIYRVLAVEAIASDADGTA
jgi:adenylate cyclase